MTDETKKLCLAMLKQDLQILHNSSDEYLVTLLEVAEAMIAREGIVLGDGYEDRGLVVMYAAWLYRKRADPDGVMPRFLRYGLNNRLFSQKAGGSDATR